MTTQSLANSHSAARRRLAIATARSARTLWRQLDDLRAWPILLPRLLVLMVGAQAAVAGQADAYVAAVLGDDAGEAAGAVAPLRLAGIASDGRPLPTLLRSPEVAARISLSRGSTMPQAMATGEKALARIVRTQVADAGRVADGIAIAARPRIGYVRMLVPPGDCSRCIILAGRFYRWNDGFQRHPRCNCSHIPAREDEAADLRTDPRAAFDALPPKEQDRIFTKSGAQAIRDGADMSQVVNARRGMETAAGGRLTRSELLGQQVFRTSEGVTRRGTAGRTLGKGRRKHGRLMPESIYELATSRDDAVRLLRLNGYIT